MSRFRAPSPAFSLLAYVAGAVGLALVVQAAPVAAAEPGRLSVSGSGEASVAPDIATLELAVVSEAPTAREALTRNNTSTGEVLAALRGAGIVARDIRTAGISITPRREQASGSRRVPGEIVAYSVQNALSVVVRDIARVGEILDRSVSLGVNDGGRVRFGNADTGTPMREARKRAVADAMDRARTLAEAAGVRLGPIESVQEQGGPRPMAGATMMRAANAGAVPVAPGENTYSVRVDITWRLAQ